MDNVQKHNNYINMPSSQTFTPYLHLSSLQVKYKEKYKIKKICSRVAVIITIFQTLEMRLKFI
jgi:hypothetical protein